MKKLIFSLGFAALSFLMAHAQEYTESQIDETSTAQQPVSQGLSNELEGIDIIDVADLSEEASNFLQENYHDATVGQIYEISGPALTDIMSNRSNGSVTNAFSNPDKLYQVQITTNQDKNMMLYLTEDGKLYDKTSLD